MSAIKFEGWVYRGEFIGARYLNPDLIEVFNRSHEHVCHLSRGDRSARFFKGLAVSISLVLDTSFYDFMHPEYLSRFFEYDDRKRWTVPPSSGLHVVTADRKAAGGSLLPSSSAKPREPATGENWSFVSSSEGREGKAVQAEPQAAPSCPRQRRIMAEAYVFPHPYPSSVPFQQAGKA